MCIVLNYVLKMGVKIQNGAEDVIAIFSSDPTCGSNGRWDGHRETDCGADLVDLAEWFDDSNGEYDDAWDINSSKSISLISPDCDNNGIYVYTERHQKYN
mgnify:CR=1 FL=1